MGLGTSLLQTRSGEALQAAGVEILSYQDRDVAVNDVIRHAFGGLGGPPEMMMDWLAGDVFKQGKGPLYKPLPCSEDGSFPSLPERESLVRYLTSWVFVQVMRRFPAIVHAHGAHQCK